MGIGKLPACMIAPVFLALWSTTSGALADVAGDYAPDQTFETWRPRTAQELKTTLIALPAPSGAAQLSGDDVTRRSVDSCVVLVGEPDPLRRDMR
jgi:hypothetical protein